jgi:hypothetical protein
MAEHDPPEENERAIRQRHAESLGYEARAVFKRGSQIGSEVARRYF